MNTRWKEIAGDMLEPKQKDIYSQFSSTLWKGHNNRIWFQAKDDVMMKRDRIWFLKYKSKNWNPTLYSSNPVKLFIHPYQSFFLLVLPTGSYYQM